MKNEPKTNRDTRNTWCYFSIFDYESPALRPNPRATQISAQWVHLTEALFDGASCRSVQYRPIDVSMRCTYCYIQ